MYDFPNMEATAREALEADAARVKAAAADRQAIKARADALEADHQARIAAPSKYYGVHLGGGAIRYGLIPLTEEGLPPAPKRRTLEIKGVNLEHVSTDADGVWIYREM